MPLDYRQIEDQLVGHLPELRPAAENYWRVEGRPGEDSGPYIFFESMFATYVQVLLHLSSSSNRDRLLSRAFLVLDLMLTSGDKDVHDLGFIGLLEGREAWWLLQSKPFLGAAAQRELDQWSQEWRNEIAEPRLEPAQEIIDLYDVRSMVAKELHISLNDVPGQTFMDEQAS